MSSFVKRQINLAFTSGDQALSLEGLRCSLVIANYGGYQGSARMQLRAFGMTLEQMNQYSAVGANMVAIGDVGVTVSVGDQGGVITQIFSGFVYASYIDTAAIPEMSFVVAAQSGYNLKGLPAAANPYAGAQNAEDLIKSLAESIGFKFINDQGAHAVIQNQYVSGSVIDQMETIAKAVAIPLIIENGSVTIWPNDKYRDDVIVDLGPDNGLVGYPSYWDTGFIVKSLYNPLIGNGRRINLRSSIPKANGIIPIMTTTHELSTMQPDGPWFTTARLAPPPYVSPN